FILLLIDYYIGRKYTLKTLIEKIPFFAISLTIGLVNIISHKTSGDVIFEGKAFSLLNTILISNYSLVFYFNKLFFPLNLSVIYPYPSEHLVLPLKYFISILIIPFVLFLLFKSGKFKKDFIFGLLFFFLSIIILLRIIPSGFFYAANRYSYISYTGLFFIIAQFFCWVMDNKFSFSKQIKNYVIIFFIGLFIFYSVSTIYRVKVWENSITLFDDIIEKHPNLDIAYNNRGIAKKDLLDYQGAIDDFSKAAEVNPKFAAAYNNRGEIRRILNQNDLAMADFNKAILINDKYVEAYNNRGIIYYNYGKFKLALEDYNQAAILSPKNNVIYHNRGNIKLMLKDTAGACRDWNRAEQFGNTAVRKIIDFYCK
ncbi:MAG: tetratricopeptide repeat protein, partial [Bacteroidales bacterium]|nr:tetratricopeptide repeat protein [Bacteroidales bacterium]